MRGQQQLAMPSIDRSIVGEQQLSIEPSKHSREETAGTRSTSQEVNDGQIDRRVLEEAGQDHRAPWKDHLDLRLRAGICAARD